MDHRDLLKKYMILVIDREGTSCVSEADLGFTTEELTELRAVETEAERDLGDRHD